MPRPRPMVYYSQNREDVLLDRVFEDVDVGFYVDVGANDPVTHSVTNHFYNHGWHGINIEPGLIFATLAAARPRDVNLNVAVSDEPGTHTFYEYPGAHGVSSFSPEVPALPTAWMLEGRIERQVPARTLRDVFEEHRPPTIDFMSIDVEGYERQVLLSNDWDRWRPRVLMIEATLPCQPIPCHDRWQDVVLGAGYLFAQFDGLNRYYLRCEDLALLERFATPVNVFDECIDHKLAVLEQELEAQRHETAHYRDRTRHLLEIKEMHEHHIAKLTAELTWLMRGTGRRTLEMGLWVARQLQRLSQTRNLLRKQGSPEEGQSRAA